MKHTPSPRISAPLPVALFLIATIFAVAGTQTLSRFAASTGETIDVAEDVTSSGAVSSSSAREESSDSSELSEFSTSMSSASSGSSQSETSASSSSSASTQGTTSSSASEAISQIPATILLQSDRDSYIANETATIRTILHDAEHNPLCDEPLLWNTETQSGTTAGCSDIPLNITEDATTVSIETLTGSAVIAQSSLELLVTEAPSVRFSRSGSVLTESNTPTEMVLVVEPSVTFIGTVTEELPDGTILGAVTPAAFEENADRIVWNRQWEAGERHELTYTVTLPKGLHAFGPAVAEGTPEESSLPAEDIVSSSSVSSEESSVSASSFSSEATSSSDDSSSSVDASASSQDSSDSTEAFSSQDSSDASVSSAFSSSAFEDDDGKDKKEKDEKDKKQASFFTRILSSLLDSLLHDELHVVEERSWNLLVWEIFDEASGQPIAAASSSSSSIETVEETDGGIVLETTKDAFGISEGAVFRLMQEDADIDRDGDLSDDEALSALAETLLSDDDAKQIVLETLVASRAGILAEHVLQSSIQVNDLRESIGANAGSIKRDDLLQTVLVDTVINDAALRKDLVEDLAGESAVQDLVDDLLTETLTNSVKQAIARAAATDTSPIANVEEALYDSTTSLVEAASAISSHIEQDEQSLQSIVEAVDREPAARVSESVLTVSLRNANGNVFTPDYHFKKGSVLLVLEPLRTFTPGVYTLEVILRNPVSGEEQMLTQDFLWGVLAMNPNKDTYRPGDRASVAIGVLDDGGNIVCDAAVTLEVISPSGETLTLTTEDQSITVTGNCGVKNSMLTDPDYETFLTLSEEGTYDLTLTAETESGIRTMTSEILVESSPAFVIERTAATRLYPYGSSPMTLDVTFTQDFDGTIQDLLPEHFTVSNISSDGEVTEDEQLPGGGTGSVISWNIEASEGETIELSYLYDAPNISPEFYLVGPLQLQPDDGALYTEQRAWQIANDANITWDGGGVTDNWNDCDNWTGNSCPGTGDIAVFDNTSDDNVTINASIDVAGINIATGYDGTITQAAAMTIGASGWTQSGATFTGGSQAISISGQFNMDGGTFVSTSGTLTQAADFIFAGGTFNQTVGTVNFAICNGTVNPGSADFNDVTISPGCNMTISGTLDVNDDLAITSVENLGGGTITVAGDYVSTDANAHGVFITLDGTGDQTMSAGGGTAAVGNITINKSSGTLFLSDTLSVGGFTLTAGTINAGSSTVQFSMCDSTISAGATRFNHIIFNAACDFSISGALDVNGNFTQIAANNITGGEIHVAGNVITSDASANAGPPIILDGTGSQVIESEGSGVFPSGTLRIAKPSGIATLSGALVLNTSGQDLVMTGGILNMSTFGLNVNDKLTLSGGTLNQGAGTLTGATISLASGAKWINDSTGDVFVGAGGVYNKGGYIRMNTSGGACSSSDLIQIRSTAAASQRSWTGSGSTQGAVLMYDVDIQDMAGTSPITVYSGTSSNNGSNFTFNGTCPSERHWAPAVGGGTTWATAGNWLEGSAPTSSEAAVFDGGTSTGASIGSSIDVLGIKILSGYSGTITQAAAMTVGASGWTQSGATFTGGSQAVDINGVFSMDGGTFIATSDTLTIGKDELASDSTLFAIGAAATFTHNSGTVKFDANSSSCCFTYTLDVNTSLTLNNVILSNNNAVNYSSLAVADGDTIIAAGTFTYDFWTAGTNATSGNWEVQGNYIVTPLTGWETLSDWNSGIITFTGTADQTYSYTSGAGPGLAIDKSTGSVTPAEGITALAASSFTLTQGTFTAPSGTFDIGGNQSPEALFTVASGTTFNHNSGTVSFSPWIGGCCSTFSLDLPTTLTLNNVTTLNSGANNYGTLSVTSGDTLIIAGNLIHDFDGEISALVGAWNVKGNLKIGSAATTGSATLTLIGTGSQIIESEGGTWPSGTFKIAKSAGVATLSGALVLNTSGQDLIMTGGTLSLEGANITVNDIFTVGTGTTLILKGTETISGGPDFYHKNSTVVYEGAAGATGLPLGDSYQNLSFSGAGTWTLDATLDVNGHLTLSGGTLDVDSGNNAITLSGSWLNGGGAFTERQGTVTLDGRNTNNQIRGNETFYNLTVNSSGGHWTIPSGTTTVSNLFTLTDGRFTVGNGATLTTTGTSTTVSIASSKIFSNSGTVILGGAPTPASVSGTWSNGIGSTVILSGNSSDDTVTVPALRYQHFRINNTGSTFNLAANLTASGNILLGAGLLDVTASNYGITAEGSWTDTATGDQFNPRSGTVTYQGIGAITANEAFNNMSFAAKGLVGHWRLDESSAGTFADSSGNGRVGTGQGATGTNNTPQPSTNVATGFDFPNPRSFSFDGTDDYVGIADNDTLDNTTALTVSAWVRSDGKHAISDQTGILGKAVDTSSQNAYSWNTRTDGSLNVVINDANVGGGFGWPNALVTDQWRHLTMVFDGTLDASSRAKFYNNGTLVATQSVADTSIMNSSSDLYIGKLRSASDSYLFFGGHIDDVRIYRRALAASEVAALAAGNPSGSGMTLGSSLDVDGDLTLRTGTLNAGTNNINVAGTWENESGTLSGANLVTLDGTNQTLSGSTAFYNLKKNASTSQALTFGAGTTQTASGTLTLTGATVGGLSLRSSVTDTQWNINAENVNIRKVDVKDSNNLAATLITCSDGCVNSQNNDGWIFPWTGVVYTDEGVTPVGADRTVTVAFNGIFAGSGSTDSDGAYAIIIDDVPADGDIISIYLDGESEKAALATRTDGVSLSDFDLYQNRLILRHETGSALTTTHLNTADNVADTDFTDFYTITGNDLTVSSSRELYINTGDTFTPDGTLAVTDIDINGTLTMGANAVTVSGTWDATGGTFTGSNTVTFDSPANETVHSGSGTWQNVTFNASAGEWDMQNPMAVSGALVITSGTLEANGHGIRNRAGTFSNLGKLKLNGNEAITNFTMDTDSGETVFTGSSSYTGLAGITTFNHLSFSGAGTWTLNNAIVTNGALTLSGGTLDTSASNYGISVKRGWRDASSGTFVERRGTVTFTGTGTLHSNEAFSGVLLNMRGSNLTLGNALALGGNLTLSGGTLKASSSNHQITLSGSWLTKANGSFDSASGAVVLDSGTHQTLSGSTTFWDLSKSVTSASTLTFAATTTQTVKGTWTAAGLTSNLLSLRSSQTGTAWSIDPKRTRTLSFVDVKDSTNINATTILCSSDCINSGANSNWAFPITVTVYTNSGITLAGSDVTVGISVNGGSTTTAETNSSGVASFTSVGLTSGDVVTMWIEGETPNGATVTVTNATSLNFAVYKDYLIVRHEAGSSITNTHLDTANNISDSDIDAIYTMSGTTQLMMADNTTLLVWPGSTYEPNGKVNVDNIDIRGTFTMEGNTVTVGGTWDATDGTVSGSNTVIFQADSTEYITSDGNTFNNVTFVVEGDNAQWVTTDAMNVTGSQAVQNPNASTDTTAPTITNISASVITDTGAVITWSTNESANSSVVYGTSSGSLNLTGTGTSNLNLNHAVFLEGLTASTLYYYKVVSTDLAGNTATGSLASFVTDEDPAEALAEAAAAAGGGGGGGGGTYADKSKPLLTSALVTNITGSSAVVTWTTNEWANSMVKFGIKTVDENGIFDIPSLEGAVEHSVMLKDLLPNTAYKVVAISIDRGGNAGVTDELSFTTAEGMHGAAGEMPSEEELENIEDPEAYLEEALARALEIVNRLADQVSLVALNDSLTDFTISIKDIARILPPPVLTGEPKVTVTNDTAIIEWISDELANSMVSFSPESAYIEGEYVQTTGKPEDSVTDHSVTLTGLTPGTRYHYRVESASVLGSKALTKDFSFVTQQSSASVLNYSYDIIAPDQALFRWRTSEPATSVVTVRPYRNGIVARESARSTVSNDFSLDHELLITTFEAGTAYEIEMWGTTSAGTTVSKIIAPFTTSNVDLAPLISHVQTDAALAPGKESRVQVVISWSTNEEATSRVLYQEGVAAENAELAQSTSLNQNFTRRHLVLLPNLNPGALYSFRVENTDSNNQTTVSRTFTIITPKQQESIVQVILGQMEDAFGWLNNLRR